MGVIEVYGKCTECGEAVEKRLVSRKSSLCLYHYRLAKKGTGIKSVSEKQKEVLADDQKFYRLIWKKKKHVSELSGKPLGDKMKSIFFSHILPKKNYPRFRHREDNIMLMTAQEHHDWEFTDRKNEIFDKVKEKYEKLLQEYNSVK